MQITKYTDNINIAINENYIIIVDILKIVISL